MSTPDNVKMRDYKQLIFFYDGVMAKLRARNEIQTIVFYR